MPSITQLEYIVAVDKLRHFRKAAQTCHVSQPSLSAQIQKLEEELDIIIFDRSKQPILTTDMGKKIIEQAKIVLREHQKISFLAGQESLVPEGSLSLGIIPTLTPYILPLFLKKFSVKYPQVNLKIHEMKTEDIIKSLEQDELDVGLLVTPLLESTIIERHLFFEPFYAFVSENHELSQKKYLKESDLNQEGLWLLADGHCLREQVLKVCTLPQKSTVLSNVSFESGNLETLINLVRKNSGYTLLPKLATLNFSSSFFKKHIREIKKPCPSREVSLVHARSFYKEKIIEILEEEILLSIPKDIQSLKKNQFKRIDIY